MTRIAIMQPYFVPYLGYFRLFSQADIFVVYDDVQFIRRGWIHRNRLTTPQGEAAWLTLPLQKCPQDTLIQDVRLVGQPDWHNQALRRFPALSRPDPHDLKQWLFPPVLARAGSLVDVLETQLKAIAQYLEIEIPEMIRSSRLKAPSALRGQERILWLCEQLGGTEYVNAPGGKDLYTEQDFAERGIQLRFLSPYQGSFQSILERILTETQAELREEWMQN